MRRDLSDVHVALRFPPPRRPSQGQAISCRYPTSIRWQEAPRPGQRTKLERYFFRRHVRGYRIEAAPEVAARLFQDRQASVPVQACGFHGFPEISGSCFPAVAIRRRGIRQELELLSRLTHLDIQHGLLDIIRLVRRLEERQLFVQPVIWKRGRLHRQQLVPDPFRIRFDREQPLLPPGALAILPGRRADLDRPAPQLEGHAGELPVDLHECLELAVQIQDVVDASGEHRQIGQALELRDKHSEAPDRFAFRGAIASLAGLAGSNEALAGLGIHLVPDALAVAPVDQAAGDIGLTPSIEVLLDAIERQEHIDLRRLRPIALDEDIRGRGLAIIEGDAEKRQILARFLFTFDLGRAFANLPYLRELRWTIGNPNDRHLTPPPRTVPAWRPRLAPGSSCAGRARDNWPGPCRRPGCRG